MKYRQLGTSGLVVSRLTLGTMTFGAEDWGCDEKIAHDIIRAYLELGGNALDGADVYAGTRSETIIGRLLPELDRDALVISSKCYFPVTLSPNRYGLSRKHIVASCEASLKRLGTDYLDLYYLHGPDPLTPMEESLRALDDLVRQGKVRYTGCSNWFGWQVTKAHGLAGRMNAQPISTAQVIYNLVHRDLEREVVPACIDAGVGVMSYSPLGGGLLTGKYKGMETPEAGSRLFFREKTDGPRFWNEKGFLTARTLEAVASECGVPMTQLAIAWPLGRPFVSSVIIGARSPTQLKQNMTAGEWDMPREIWDAIEEKTRPPEDYQTWFSRVNYARSFDGVEFHYPDRELL